MFEGKIDFAKWAKYNRKPKGIRIPLVQASAGGGERGRRPNEVVPTTTRRERKVNNQGSQAEEAQVGDLMSLANLYIE